MANSQLDTNWLAIRESTKLTDERREFHRRAKGAMADGTAAVHNDGHTARFGDFKCDLGGRQDATMTQLWPLARA